MDFLLRLPLVIASVVVCVIPARYRRNWPLKTDADLRGPAILSGTLEFLIGAAGTVFYFAVVMQTARSGLGIAGIFLNPFLTFPWLLAEGAVRLLAALGPAQILPTLPLQIIAWIHDRIDCRLHVKSLGPLLPDLVEKGDGAPWDLRVRSCRPKPHWNTYVTIRFEENFYQLIREVPEDGPRKFAYLLRLNPKGRIVVVVFEYCAQDGLNPALPPRRWSPS